jgi:ribosomal protein S6--L-glutamate ligase
LVKNKINHPKTYQAMSFISYKQIAKELLFPIIAKPVRGRQGMGIKKINNEKNFLKFIKKNYKGYLVQQYIKTDGDLRVFVVGDEVLGAIKRFVVPGDFRSNVSLGAKAKKVAVTKKIKEISLKAAKAMDFEVAGVDLIKHKNKYYVIEVNNGPQWQKFKEVTKINPAKKIIDYAINKFENNNPI